MGPNAVSSRRRATAVGRNEVPMAGPLEPHAGRQAAELHALYKYTARFRRVDGVAVFIEAIVDLYPAPLKLKQQPRPDLSSAIVNGHKIRADRDSCQNTPESLREVHRRSLDPARRFWVSLKRK